VVVAILIFLLVELDQQGFFGLITIFGFLVTDANINIFALLKSQLKDLTVYFFLQYI